MKRILTLAFVALATMISSCSKDEKNSLEGTWQLESREVDDVAVSLTECEKKSTITFTNSTFRSIDYNVKENDCVESNEEYTYSTSGNVLTFSEQSKNMSYTYSVSGNKLTLTAILLTYDNNKETKSTQISVLVKK